MIRRLFHMIVRKAKILEYPNCPQILPNPLASNVRTISIMLLLSCKLNGSIISQITDKEMERLLTLDNSKQIELNTTREENLQSVNIKVNQKLHL